jgi:hypothetical protein
VNPLLAGSPSVEYQKIRGQIQTGDILLFRGRRLLSKVIEGISHAPYSHVAFLTKWEGRIVAMQSDLRGVEVIPASMLVCQYEGTVEWWRLREPERGRLDTRDFLDRALTLVGVKYGYGSLIWLAVRMLLGVSVYRKFSRVRPSTLFCSSFVSYCYMNEGIAISAKAGVDGTSPSDFAASGYFVDPHQLFDGSDHSACDQLLGTKLGRVRKKARGQARGSVWNGRERRDPRAAAGALPPAAGPAAAPPPAPPTPPST